MSAATANSALMKKLLLVCVAMFGFGFALVPLYDVFCSYTGINGKTDKVAAAVSTKIDTSRSIRVEFLAINDGGLPWHFAPEREAIDMHPGEVKVVNFSAENLTDSDMVAQAVPSVSPGQYAQYFKKIECFCFTQQPLAGHEKKLMPVQFYLDREIPAGVTTVTLSYRMYQLKNQQAVNN
jgi:cytochrome c oxidase assembly protein subunit 11